MRKSNVLLTNYAKDLSLFFIRWGLFKGLLPFVRNKSHDTYVVVGYNPPFDPK